MLPFFYKTEVATEDKHVCYIITVSQSRKKQKQSLFFHNVAQSLLLFRLAETCVIHHRLYFHALCEVNCIFCSIYIKSNPLRNSLTLAGHALSYPFV